MYTREELIITQVRYKEEKGCLYDKDYILHMRTVDGLYETTPPNSEGYAYWIEKKIPMEDKIVGQIGMDYIFPIEEGVIDALYVLNRNIKETT